MSRFSGKCDLADHILMEKLRTIEGSDNPDELAKSYVLYSDPMECFKIFKKKTGGVIYQHKRVNKVYEWNQDFIAEHCPQFEIIKHKTETPDKRAKSGMRVETTYTYKYWDKEYTAKELSKKGVYITIKIHFNTLLDLIPYFPYTISVCCCDGSKETVYISDNSFVEEHADDAVQHGYEYDTYYYRHELAEFYRECVLKYYNPAGKENIEEVEFDENGIGKVSKHIDTEFDIKWYWYDGEVKSHWTSPEVVDAEKGIIKMSHEDLTNYLGNKMLVYYVEYKEPELWLK